VLTVLSVHADDASNYMVKECCSSPYSSCSSNVVVVVDTVGAGASGADNTLGPRGRRW